MNAYVQRLVVGGLLAFAMAGPADGLGNFFKPADSGRTDSPIPAFDPNPAAIKAMRLDFNNMKNSRAEVRDLERKMIKAGVNTVALGAGRVDWTYFRWKGQELWWSSDLKEAGIDFLAQDAARFGAWALIDAVVDVLAPRYIAAHPRAAAVSWLGKRNDGLVSTTELVKGEFGNLLVELIGYIAANYPVNSVSITEMAYYVDGYGDDDKAAYLAASRARDWPRNVNGSINIDDPSIGQWRSAEIGRFLERAAAAAHRYGKKLYFDVGVNWGRLKLEAADHGQDYSLMLRSADRLVVWNYFGLSDMGPEYTSELARYLGKYGPDKIILSIGLWAKNDGRISPDSLREALLAVVGSDIPHLWITPSHFLSEEHWRVLSDIWSRRN